MVTAQIAERETLFHRILNLPDEEIGLVERYVTGLEGLEEHKPNEETIAAILEGDELARMYCSHFAIE